MSHDSFPPASLPPSRVERTRAYAVAVTMGNPVGVPPVAMGNPAGVPQTPPDALEVGFRDVAGFPEALTAAEDPRAPTPSRLVLVDPDEHARAWLDRWAEDVDQVRRRITVRRADGAEVTLIATLASFGTGAPTSLSVESIRPNGGGAILRSGVHPRAEVDAALALLEAAFPADAP